MSRENFEELREHVSWTLYSARSKVLGPYWSARLEREGRYAGYLVRKYANLPGRVHNVLRHHGMLVKMRRLFDAALAEYEANTPKRWEGPAWDAHAAFEHERFMAKPDMPHFDVRVAQTLAGNKGVWKAWRATQRMIKEEQRKGTPGYGGPAARKRRRAKEREYRRSLRGAK